MLYGFGAKETFKMDQALPGIWRFWKGLSEMWHVETNLDKMGTNGL
jgi:hypothetical protein